MLSNKKMSHIHGKYLLTDTHQLDIRKAKPFSNSRLQRGRPNTSMEEYKIQKRNKGNLLQLVGTMLHLLASLTCMLLNLKLYCNGFPKHKKLILIPLLVILQLSIHF